MNRYDDVAWRTIMLALLVFFPANRLIAQVNDQDTTNEIALPQNEANVASEDQIALTDDNFVDVIVPTVDGTLVWKDVAGQLANTLSLDAPSLERMFPTGSLDLRSPTTVLALFGIDMALGDAVTIQMTQDAAGVPGLRFRCDKKALGLISPKAKKTRPANIQLDLDWKQRTELKPLVVCFHGLKSGPVRFDAFRGYIRQSGFATAAVSYDDQQSIVDSAGDIFQIGKQLFGDAPLKLVLVGHSMGGLVARELTENAKFSAAKVEALITVATPHGGSNWASLPPLLDLFADKQVDSTELIDVILNRPSSPGFRDLAPDSAYVAMLRQRKLNADVRYTTIVGTGSPVSQAEVDQMRSTLQSMDQDGSVVRLIRPRIEPLLNSFDELVQGKGDGVVAVENAKIALVDDVVTVPLAHTEMFSPPKEGQVHPVWSAIVQRIKQ